MFLLQTETPTWLVDPRFWLLVISAAVALVMWFARLEFKTNANQQRQVEYEGEMDERRKEDRAEFRALKGDFYGHKGDTTMHHNAEMFREFREGLERRFTGMEGTLGEINRKIDRLPETRR